MSDDSEPPKQTEFEPNGPSNRGPGKARIGAADGDDDFLRLLKRAVRKLKRETGGLPTLLQLSDLLKISMDELRVLLENYVAADPGPGSLFKSALALILLSGKNSEPQPDSAPGRLWSGRFRPGQKLRCKVLAAEPGGYGVIITDFNLRGFLPTEAKLGIGEELLAQYVCVHQNRILLSARLSGAGKAESPSPPRSLWHTLPRLADSRFQSVGDHIERGKPSGMKMRRAIDLILPPIDRQQRPNRMRISQEDDLLWIITDLEGGQRTGCVKAFCQSRESRSAALLYRGRAVGCIYGNKQLVETQATEGSLQLMLRDCKIPETHLVMYALPEEVILAMASLFLGYPVERSDDLDSRSYMDYILSWFQQREQTACLAFALPTVNCTLLAFVHLGEFAGSFNVDTQEFSQDINDLYNLIREDPNSRVEASVLPVELLSSSVRLGFSLSMNMPR